MKRKRKKEEFTEERPSRVFVVAGYTVACRLDGIEIQTVDYHAGVLKLSWPEIERLMVEAGWVPPKTHGYPCSCSNSVH
jgi:hypothetical protein